MQLNTKEFFETRGKYLENRAKFSPEELKSYMGKWIAWSADGSHIAASADSEDELIKIVIAAGEVAQDWIIEGLPEQGVDTYLGGFWSEEPV